MTVRVVFNRLPALAREYDDVVERELERAAFATEAAAKRLAPVDTGNLKNSIITRQDSDDQWTVTSAAEYSIYQEYGTDVMPAQPYMRPAVDEVAEIFIRRVKDAMR